MSKGNPPASARATYHTIARLDITNLDDTVLKLFLAGLADSTKQTYKSGACRYLEVCNQFSAVSLTLYPRIF